jgi:ankyrin repeat protein
MRAKVILAVGLCMALAACGDKQLSSLEKLAEKGYSLSISEYFRAAKAGDIAALDLFLKSGTAVDVPDEKGDSALVHATRAGKAEAVRFLIESGARLEDDRRLLPLAIASGKAEVVDAFLKARVNTAIKDDSGLAPLELAAKLGSAAITELLLPSSVALIHTALVHAATNGDTATLDLLLQAEASPFFRDNDGKTALHRAAEAGHADAAQLLLTSGASRFALDHESRTPLELAAAHSHTSVVRLLQTDLTSDELSFDAARSSQPTVSATTDQELKEVPAAIPLTEDAASLHLLRRLPALDAAIVDHRVSVTGFPAKPEDRLSLRLIRPQQVPWVLESIESGTARFRSLVGKNETITVKAGQPLPGSAFVFASARSEPDTTSPLPASWFPNALLHDPAKNTRHLAIAHLPVREGALTAVVEVPETDEIFEARAGDRFYFFDDEQRETTVMEITPRRIVLRQGGHTWALQ